MPLSEKRLAANRANALKSTGPRTERGKRIAAMNCRRDWALAKNVLVTNESRDRFIGLLHSFQDHYKPQTPHERALVDTMAVARWRISRLWSLESSNIIKAVRDLPESENCEDAPTQTVNALRSGEGTRTQELLSRYEARYDRQYHRAAEALEQAIALRERREKFLEHHEPTQLPQNQGECR
jgi:hypothetical protein